MNGLRISQIHKNADLIWMHLCNHCFWDIDELKETTTLSDSEILLALGWLARQGDISFVKIDDKVRIVLAANVFY